MKKATKNWADDIETKHFPYYDLASNKYFVAICFIREEQGEDRAYVKYVDAFSNDEVPDWVIKKLSDEIREYLEGLFITLWSY